MSGVLSELTCLGLARPGVSAGPGEVAAYFEAVARVHAHLAAEVCGGEATTERELAASAECRAVCLRSIPDYTGGECFAE